METNYAVLFVDDEPNILNSLKRGLMYEKYTCHFASSGKEALEVMSKETIHVIVSDMRMPEMTGLQLLKEVSNLYPKTVRIILSGYTQLPQILATINQVSIFKFITKPWNLEDEFQVVIRQALDYYKLVEENEENKKALQTQNQAYQNILKGMDDKIHSAKRNSEILGICGKQILLFNRTLSFGLQQENLKMLQHYEETTYELFTKAVQIEEKDIKNKALIDNLFKIINNEIKITNFEDKLITMQTLKIRVRIAEAILLSTILVFREEFTTYGLYMQASENTKGQLILSLVAPNVYSAPSLTLDEKLHFSALKMDFLNTLNEKIAAAAQMSYTVSKSNQNLLAVLAFEKN